MNGIRMDKQHNSIIQRVKINLNDHNALINGVSFEWLLDLSCYVGIEIL